MSAGDDERIEGNRLMVSGVALGAIGAASAVLLGATCPLCVVGAPALVGWGAYKRWKASRSDEPVPTADADVEGFAERVSGAEGVSGPVAP
jgi:hypothetical protein